MDTKETIAKALMTVSDYKDGQARMKAINNLLEIYKAYITAKILTDIRDDAVEISDLLTQPPKDG